MVYRRIAVLIVLMAIVTGCGVLPEEEGALVPPIITPEEIPFRTIILERQAIEDAVTVRGAVAPAVMENYYFDTKGGRIKSYNVRVGDFVEEGDILIELVVDQLDENIAYQKITVANLSEDYTSTKSIQSLQRSKKLAEINQQKSDLEAMQAYSALYTPREIQDAQRDLNNGLVDYEILELTHGQNLNQKKKSLDLEQLKLSDYQATLEASFIRAAMPGVVTYIQRGFIGDTVTDFETLISVADITEMQVDYQGSQAYRFDLGMPVELVYRGQSYTGMVTLTPDSVPSEDKASYINSAVFSIDTVPENYIMGDDVDIRALLDARESAIVLPKDAIKTFGSDDIVYVLEDGEKRERYITLGIESGPYVEVVEGLEEGDEVIIN